MKKNKKIPGFTLIELIIYIGILLLFVGLLGNFYISIRQTGVRADVASQLQHSAQLILHRISQDVRAADTLVTANANTLSVTRQGTATTYTTVPRTYLLGGQNLISTVLQRTVGVGPAEDLNNSPVSVSEFLIENRTRGSEAPNVKISFTLTYQNPGEDIHRAASLSLETSVTLRSSAP